jgi:hypothetical protein
MSLISCAKPSPVVAEILPKYRDLSVAFWDTSVLGIDCSTGGSLTPVPLPAALPLFGSAVLGLAGFAVRKSRKQC